MFCFSLIGSSTLLVNFLTLYACALFLFLLFFFILDSLDISLLILG